MEIETTKMSSKGQIVIPGKIRAKMDANEGTMFVVMSNGDTIVLKKIEMPSKEELLKQLEGIAIEGKKNAEKLGIKENDVPNIIHRFRKSKSK